MKTPADVAVTAEAFEFDRCIMARRAGQVLPFSKSAKDSCVQHLAILAAGCAVPHHPTTFDKSHEVVYQTTFRCSSVEHHTRDYGNSVNKTPWIAWRPIDSCLFCKSIIQTNPRPGCRHSDNNRPYPGSSVRLGQCWPTQDLHAVPRRLCTALI